MQKFKETLEIFNKILEINPKHTPTYMEKAKLLISTGKFDEANATFDELKKIEPENKEVDEI